MKSKEDEDDDAVNNLFSNILIYIRLHSIARIGLVSKLIHFSWNKKKIIIRNRKNLDVCYKV